MHEEPFGYRVAHHGYLLTSRPGNLTKVGKLQPTNHKPQARDIILRFKAFFLIDI